MKLHIFQSDKGDCLLLEGNNGGRVLCDGGMSSTMQQYVRSELSKLRGQGESIDYAYVSHIDQDHISGVLRLLEDELLWRVYDHNQQSGNPSAKPRVPRPPAIGGILHNAFRDQVGANAGKVTDLLAAAADVGLSSTNPRLIELGSEMQNIALSVPEAIRVSHLASPKILKIPVNRLPGQTKPAKLLMVRARQKPFQVGSMIFTIVGPTADEIEQLRDGWNLYLADPENFNSLKKLREKLEKSADEIGQSSMTQSEWESYKGVSVPNIASLMLMVEEGGKRLLLTGDSQQDIIIKGLELTGYLKSGSCHLDALKVQHHGSENNLDEAFCRKVSADHYIFCGNGEHGNPDPRVIQAIYDSRLGPAGKRALSATSTGRPFTFWFSTTSTAQKAGSKERKAFSAIENLVASLAQSSAGQMSAKFNSNAGITLSI
ncbi:MAG: MBL fold metallo-hydrolase [Sphingorhabdus sp.]|uniref:MBL fold metallo-hydrolase n=1 Tax=Sphingorhabdus sp. TaxID=1902408 RepID=UPI0038FCEFEA